MEEAEPYDIATVLPFLTYTGSNVMWFRRTYDPPHWAPSMHFHAYPMPISVIHHLQWDHASFTDRLGPKQLAASSMPHQHLSPNMQIAELPSFLPNLPLDPRMLRTYFSCRVCSPCTSPLLLSWPTTAAVSVCPHSLPLAPVRKLPGPLCHTVHWAPQGTASPHPHRCLVQRPRWKHSHPHPSWRALGSGEGEVLLQLWVLSQEEVSLDYWPPSCRSHREGWREELSREEYSSRGRVSAASVAMLKPLDPTMPTAHYS